MASILDIQTIGKVWVISADTSPLTSGGLDAPVGSLLTARDGTGSFYKFGAGINDWDDLSGGGGGDANFVFNQSVPSVSWVVIHGLNKRCSVQVVDNTGNELIAEVVWDSNNQVTVNFNSATTGYVYCN